MQIHPTAIVSEKVKFGKNVTIGPFSIIEDDVIIGDDTEIHAHVLIRTGTTIGTGCKVFQGAVIGHDPQDIKFDVSIPTRTNIGNNTTIREYSTIHRGTDATGFTAVGDNCLIMAYTHVAHDCHLGNNLIIANATQMGGHVTIDDWVIIGGGALIHQFVSVGAHCMVQGGSRISQDVSPYSLIGKEPPKFEGLNKIGLLRRGFSKETIKEIENFYKYILYNGLNLSEGLKKYLEDVPEPIKEVKNCIDFIKNSKRGITR